MKWSKNVIAKVGRIKTATKIDMDAVANYINERADSYQYERAIRFGVSTRDIGYELKRLEVIYDKNIAMT